MLRDRTRLTCEDKEGYILLDKLAARLTRTKPFGKSMAQGGGWGVGIAGFRDMPESQ